MARVEQQQERDNVTKLTGNTADQTIEQVRELLFGDTKRTTERKQADLEKTVDALRADILERLSILEAKMLDLDREAEQRHVTAVQGIGAAISDLGALVTRLADAPRKK